MRNGSKSLGGFGSEISGISLHISGVIGWLNWSNSYVSQCERGIELGIQCGLSLVLSSR